MEKAIYQIIAAVLLTATATRASANGFALAEQSASGMGNAFAGGGASVEDASTLFFNPAGMAYLPDNQLVIAAHALRLSTKFNNNGSRSFGGPATSGSDGGDAGDWSFIPNIYFVKAVNDTVRLGVGINAPFGFNTHYDNGWVGRYQTLKSDLKTININPSIAVKINDEVSLGLGISAMRTEAEQTSAVDFGTICAVALRGCGIGATFQKNDGYTRVQGDGWGYGWNAGALFKITGSTRLALAYRSQVHLNPQGHVDFNNVPAAFALSPALTAAFANGAASVKLTTPDSVSASIHQQINGQWDLMADLTWMRWSKFQDLTVIRTSGSLAGQTLSSVPENWDNTIRASIGASHRYNETLKLRVGLAYDQSPVPLKFRTPSTANSDRLWLSLGANFKFTATSSMDVGYTYIFVGNAHMDKTTDTAIAALRDAVKGDYNSDVNILSVQFTHTF